MNDAQPSPRNPMYPRDGAGSFTVPVTKGGSIQRVVGLRDYMEIFTEHETFRVLTPETVDPERTNPNAMWVQTKVADVGAASPYVARTLLMAHEMLSNNIVVRDKKLEVLLARMHAIKETLLHAAQAVSVFLTAFEVEVERLAKSNGERMPGGQMLAYFPAVPDIDAKITAVLIHARRLITEVCLIPETFWGLKRQHSDPTHLVEKELLPLLGEKHRLVQWLRTRLDSIKIIIDFRNGQEHVATTKGLPLIVKNFAMSPTNQIMVPGWGLEGRELTDISVDLPKIMDVLVEFAEVMLVASIDANLPDFPPMKVFSVDALDAACPIRYTLNVDEKKLFEEMQRGTAGGGKFDSSPD